MEQDRIATKQIIFYMKQSIQVVMSIKNVFISPKTDNSPMFCYMVDMSYPSSYSWFHACLRSTSCHENTHLAKGNARSFFITWRPSSVWRTSSTFPFKSSPLKPVYFSQEPGSLRYWLNQAIFRKISSVTWKYIFCGRRWNNVCNKTKCSFECFHVPPWYNWYIGESADGVCNVIRFAFELLHNLALP
jgi:hypothetical protein